MKLLYNLGIRLFSCLIFCASLFNEKARLWKNGRKRIFVRIRQQVNTGDKIAWFHCASLGEFEQGRPVIEALREKDPSFKILLTFFSPSGYEIRKNYDGADYVFYLPLDTKHNAETFVRLINPEFAVFVKYEFWYNFIRCLHRKNIPVYLISANFRPNQIFFKWHGNFFRRILHMFTHLFVQNQRSQELLSSVQVNKVSVAGDTRFDRVYAVTGQRTRLPGIEKFKQKNHLVIAGSTWKEDEELLIRFINEQDRAVKWIIAPHEIHEDHIRRIMESVKRPVLRYSEIGNMDVREFDVLVIDNIGMLSSLYYYGELAYIGGGFGKGIHNILEAATYGLPILFGPEYENFQEALDLVNMKAAFPVKSYEDIMNNIRVLFSLPKSLENAGKIAKNYVKSNLGATKIIVEKLLME